MNWFSTNLIGPFSFLFILFLMPLAACAQGSADPKTEAQMTVRQADNPPDGILKDVPQQIDAKARYLFYLHGRIIEEQGIRPTSERYGVYQYQEILESFRREGFVVISEPRQRNTDVEEYAAKVASQIERLLKAGVPPQQITVIGASKGGGITMLASTLLKNRQVNFVVMAGCYDEILSRVNLYGNVLSIYEESDGVGTCRKFFAKAAGLNRHKEVMLKTGLAHGFLYRPMKEWIAPAVEWATQP
jgi:hypothetical protein